MAKPGCKPKTSAEVDRLVKLVLIDVSHGDEVRTACKKHGVVESCFYERVAFDSALAEAYTHARASQQDAIVDKLEQIAREEEDVQRARLLIDTHKWRAAKLAASKYGDRLALAGDKASPLIVAIQRTVVDPEEGK